MAYNFITEPDPNLFCVICLELASQPKQCEDCGKLFCSECIKQYGRNPCPNCRVKKPKFFKDVRSKLFKLLYRVCNLYNFISGRRDIDEVQVRCTNTERGCRWTGTVSTLDGHIASCQFALIPCPNKCGKNTLTRLYLDQHLKIECLKRAHKCPHCGEKGTFSGITEDHDKVCEKKIVACPNKGSGCSLSTEQGKIIEHVSSDCMFAEVACVYESLGCGVRMLRKDIVGHQENEDKVHIHLMLKSFSLLKEQHKTLSEGEAVVFQLPGYTSKKKKNDVFYSTQFYTHQGGYKMLCIVYANGDGSGKGTHVSVYTKLVEGQYDHQLHWPFLGTVTFELLNQLGDDNHHRVVLVHGANDDRRFGSIKGCQKFLPHSSLGYNPATNTQYCLLDALYFRVSVKVDNHKPWLVCTDKVTVDSVRTLDRYRALKTNESVIVEVANFTAYKVSQLSVYSNSFYSHPGGYKMIIIVLPNGGGAGEGTHVSVYMKLLEGCYDNQLHWPFLGTVSFELLNQLEDNIHHKMDIRYKLSDDGRVGNNYGCSKFISHTSLCPKLAINTQYLLDDTLYFRVSVKVDSYKPWLVCTRHS